MRTPPRRHKTDGGRPRRLGAAVVKLAAPAAENELHRLLARRVRCAVTTAGCSDTTMPRGKKNGARSGRRESVPLEEEEGGTEVQ